jgi:Tol biopolymer transport system component
LTTGLDPALSPDGEQVAFVRWDGNGDAIRLINVDGSNERFFLGTNKPRSPTWSPDGSSIVYERIVEDRICRETPFGCLTDAQIRSKFDGNDCWTYPPPIGLLCIWDFPETHWQITDLEKFATTETGQVETLPTLQSAHSPYYHPAGGQVIHLTRKGLDIAYTDEDHPPESILLHPNLGAPIYSPDGQYIYISKKDGDNWDIWRYNADGSAPFALTHPPGLRDRPVNHVAPAVSPDGRHLLFLSDRNGFWQMWMMDSDGGHQRLFMPSILHDIQFQFDFGRARMIDWK